MTAYGAAWNRKRKAILSLPTTFNAKIDSSCDGCGNKTHKGDVLTRTRKGEYLCQKCATA